MSRSAEISATDIDLAAAILTATNIRPAARPGTDLAEFFFPNTEEVRSVMVAFSTGNLEQNVRRFAANRAWLYRLARQIARTGGAR